MASTKPELAASIESVRAIAIFSDKVIHLLQDRDRRQGADIVKFAARHKLKIPAVLEGFSITYDTKPHVLAKQDVARTVVVELPPRPATAAKARTISGCFDMKKGPLTAKVCVNCKISWTSISCTITITIKVGL
jgi:hypothetical protein